MESDSDIWAELARDLGREADGAAVLARVVAASTTQVDGAGHAGITLISRGSVSTPYATDDLVREIDGHQYDTGEGPCLTAAVGEHPVVRTDDLREDGRWPKFSAAVAALPVRSVLSFQLYTDVETIGALNVYSNTPYAFNDEAVHTGLVLAAHAAVAAAAAARSDNLKIALDSRDTIGQAKGILMERFKITALQAFDLLVVASQRTHRKLKDVAAEVADTGEIPTS